LASLRKVEKRFLKSVYACSGATVGADLPPCMALLDLESDSDPGNAAYLDLVWGAYGQESPTTRDRYLACSVDSKSSL
jgi:hypothetical protein